MFESADQKLDELQVDKFFGLYCDTNSTDASAISIITPATALVSGGAETRTLANGREGQMKYLFAKTAVGAITITPVNLKGYTTVVLGAAGRGATLIFCAGEWHCVSLGYGTMG